MHPLPQQPAAFHRHAIIACNQHLRLPLPQPAVYLKQAEAVVQKQHEAWEFQTRFLGMRETRLANSPRASPSLPPVVLPLPVCCKASPVGPKETRKYAIPKYAIGFVIGPNGLRIQAVLSFVQSSFHQLINWDITQLLWSENLNEGSKPPATSAEPLYFSLKTKTVNTPSSGCLVLRVKSTTPSTL